MRKSRLRATALALLVQLFAASIVAAQTGTVEQIEVQGLVRMSSEAFAHAFGIRVGDAYDPARIRQQFRELWNLKLFEDIKIEAVDAPGGGKVIIVTVKERPVLTSVSYEDNKVLTRTAIEDRFKEKKISLAVGKPLDLKSMSDAQAMIQDMLGEKGYLDPVVRYTLDAPTQATAAVRFTIKPGAKTRIRDIEFVGNTLFSDRRLMKQLKLTRPWRWWWPLSGKSLYHPAKWDQDISGVRDLYLSLGYLDINIHPPVVEVKEIVKNDKERGKREAAPSVEPSTPTESEPAADESPREARRRADKQRREAEKARKKAEKAARREEPKIRRWAFLTVRVDEGSQYKFGKIEVTGNTVLTEEQIKAAIPFVREGAIADNELLDFATKTVQRAYQNRGYAYATVRREIERSRGDELVADVKLTVVEDKQYTVDRIDFTGNTQTQDRVLRREFRLGEGELFNQSLLDLSMDKLNQLGYFEAKREDVVVAPVEGEDKVRINVPGEERGRNEIQVGGGYSGLDGAFFTGFYSTRNLLGRGQILSASVQVGGRANRYQIAFSEPWFLGRPYTLGFQLFRRDVDYGRSQRSSGTGGGVVLGRQIGAFSGIQARYDAERVTTRGFTFTTAEATNKISSFTPSYFYNRVDNPYRPSRGWMLSGEFQVSGGPLGGDTNVLRPRLEYSGYLPLVRRQRFERGEAVRGRHHFLGFHGEVGLIRPWKGGSTANTANINGVPRFSRFWLGGDTLGPRVFETRVVTPLRYVRLDPTRQVILETAKDPRNRPASDFDINLDGIVDRNDLVEVGGDRYFLAQTEYVVPFDSPMELAFFLDVGNSLFEDTSWGFEDVRVAAGVELRFYIPVFPVPLRLIYGAPIRKLPEDRTSAFQFSIGRSF